MSFKTQMTADVSNVFFNADEFAVSGSYQNGDNAAIDVLIVPHDDDADANETSEGTETAQTLFATLKRSQVSEPQVNATLTIGTDVWTIRGINGKDADTVTVICDMPYTVQRTAKNYFKTIRTPPRSGY
jgi:hypothetical protein